jgi:hypothetical protein
MLRSLLCARPALWFLALLALASGIARGQSVRWEPASGTLARNQSSQLTLVFEDAEPKETPAPPAVDGLTFGSPRRSEQSSLNITLGSRAVRRRVITYSFPVRPTRADGEVRIPAFTVDTDAGKLSVAPAGYRLADATVGQTGLPLDQVVTARFTPPAAPLWAGEVFQLGFQLDVDRRQVTNNILAGPLEWAPSPLVTEDWSAPVGTESTRNGEARFLVSMQTRAITPLVTSAQMLALPTATQLVNLPTGQSNPFAFLGQSTFEQFTVSTAPARIAVNPLPSPSPADFIGAVGQFTLSSKIVPEKASVGEPITWTLALEGVGNWPAIDRLRPRSLSRDIRVVTPRAQKTVKPGTLFEASLTEDLVLIPQKPGRTTLGPYTVSFFNPVTGTYEILRAEPVTIEISPGSAPALPDPATTPAPDEPSAAPNPGTPARAPEKVATLPADPLPPGLLAHAPLPDWPRPLVWCLLALVPPLALWLALAARHARDHDPLRARRAAHADLGHVLARLETAPPGPPPAADLLAWQHTTRALFALPAATPVARDLPDPLWAALWVETDRALYRPDTPLAVEWLAQARQAHAQATPRARHALAALRPAHLFPRVLLAAFLLASTLLTSPATIAAEPGHAAYARAEFAAAEAAFRADLARNPLDAAPRHNLALALAQQGRWDEAHAHAFAASLQRPGDPALDRLLAATAPKAGYRIQVPPTGARLLSVRGWQLLALGSALALLLLVPAACLASAYLPPPRRRPLRIAGLWTLATAAAALLASHLALRAHGPAARPSAVLVWRAATLRAVPTEAGEQQVTAELPPGTIATIDKDFLGWRRLVLPDGNTGWVRAEPLVPLWR